MKKGILYLIIYCLSSSLTFAQVGINTDNSAPDSSAGLDVKFTDKGFLPPRMTTLQRDQIPNPATGLMIFNTDCNDYQYYKGSGWISMGNFGQISQPASISGNPSPCVFATGMVYSTPPIPNANSYNWDVPAGATITTGQGTNYISVDFGTLGGSICVTAHNECYNSFPLCIPINLISLVNAGISISASETTVCQGTQVTFTSSVTNPGFAPLYQWKKNNLDIPGATNTSYSYVPQHDDRISCRLISNATCVAVPNVYSNNITLTVISLVPDSPAQGTHVVSLTDITWKWNAVSNATGYKWNTTNDYATATDMGSVTTKTESALTCGTAYTRYVWAYNGCGHSAPLTMSQSTLACQFVCGTTVLTVNHVTTGGVAPVNKTTTYGTVTNIPGEAAKCWITSNLGSTQQATSVSDDTEASAGWYWQFNRKKGYKHDGTTLTPDWTITSINENSDWLTANDPCNLELGTQWRLPTFTEWYNVDNDGDWTNWNGPWNSGLKLHAAGQLNGSNGSLNLQGSDGLFWSSTQSDSLDGWYLHFSSGHSAIGYWGVKALGFSLRCLKEASSYTPASPTYGTHEPSSTHIIWN